MEAVGGRNTCVRVTLYVHNFDNGRIHRTARIIKELPMDTRRDAIWRVWDWDMSNRSSALQRGTRIVRSEGVLRGANDCLVALTASMRATTSNSSVS